LQAIYDYFEKQYPSMFKRFDDLHPVVSSTANFDEVRHEGQDLQYL